jgi:murein DD-endopeptidase MepM/ murein hydrolase activator NlpD
MLFLPAMACAQQCVTAPAAPVQGQTIRITCPGDITGARMGDRTIRLFPQQDGNTLGLMPIPVLAPVKVYTVEYLKGSGDLAGTARIRVRNARFPTQNIRLSKATQTLQPSPGEMETVNALRKTVTDSRHWDEPFVAPVPGCMTSPFGVLRLHNGKPTGSYHSGLDQRGPEGTPIRAIASGKVRIVRMFNVHGGTVGIDHGQGVTSFYLHMSKFAATEGATLRKGDVIGYVGTTGRSTAPHLHWSLAVNGVNVNPTQWVTVGRCQAAPKTRSKK